MKKLLLLGLAFSLAGCGMDARTMAPTATTSSKAVAQEKTTEPIGATDLMGQLVKFEQGNSEHRFTVRPEGSVETVQVLVPSTLTMRVVRGNFASTGNGLALKYLYEGAHVRLNLVSKKGSPLRASEVFWDMTGIMI